MAANILDGKIPSVALRAPIRRAIAELKQREQRLPGLAVVIVGDDPASAVYVANKHKACLDVGIRSFAHHLPASTPEAELLHLLDQLNQSPEVDGILMQLPLPAHIDAHAVIDRIKPSKDVDGFHPYNLGRLAQGNPLLRPCTPYGIMQLLQHYQLDVKGQHAVVVGASNIVGKPMALELLEAKATITVCHRQTQDLEACVRQAQILIVATGSPGVVHPEWLSYNPIVIDVGIIRQADGSIRGDVDFEEARKRASWITPVPGGVGPMTITALLQNTWTAYLNAQNHPS